MQILGLGRAAWARTETYYTITSKSDLFQPFKKVACEGEIIHKRAIDYTPFIVQCSYWIGASSVCVCVCVGLLLSVCVYVTKKQTNKQ